MDDVTPERWLPVPGYEGLYEISDQGRVRSFHASRSGRMLKPSPASAGYLAVSLVKGRSKRTRTIHSLVASAFLGPRPSGQEVRHLDGNPANSTLGNLKYGTKSENRKDSVKHGTHKNTRKTRCPAGHLYTPENIYRRPGSNERQCRICMTDEAAQVQAVIRQENDDLRKVASRHRKPWTPAELLVVQSHPELRSAQLAIMLGRTRWSVDSARHRVSKNQAAA